MWILRKKRKLGQQLLGAIGTTSLCSSLFAQSTSWTFAGPIATWSTAANWNGGVPSPSTDAVFAVSPTNSITLTGPANTQNLDVVAGNITLTLGSEKLQVAGNLNLNGGNLTTPTTLKVGAAAVGQIGVTGNINLSSGMLSVGSLDTGGTPSQLNWTGGTLEISNANTTVGSAGPMGTILTLTSGKNLRVIDGPTSGTTGTLTVEGYDGILNVTGGSIYARSLDLSNSKSFSFTGGTITVSGGELMAKPVTVFVQHQAGLPGSFANSVEVNGVSTATLRLQSGGTLVNSLQNLFVGHSGKSGYILIDGPGSSINLTNGYLMLGVGRDVTGTIPGIGTLSVTNGGRASSYKRTDIGSSGGKGWATIDGSDSRLFSSSSLHVGYLGFVSDTGFIASRGTLNLTNGGQASSYNTYIGSVGGKGWTTVDGSSSKLLTSWLIIGRSEGGEGTLSLTKGGQVSSDSVTFIGSGGGKGRVHVDGKNSRLSAINSRLIVGKSGQEIGTTLAAGEGTLILTSGGQASSDFDTEIGSDGGKGLVLVAGGSLSVGGQLTVGVYQQAVSTIVYPGLGTLAVTGAGSVKSNSAVIGLRGGLGTVTLNGAGTRWANATDLFLGNDGTDNAVANGTGSLSISNGATVTNRQTIKVYTGGQLTLADGATMTTGTLDLTGSTSRLDWIGGTLRINNFAPSADGLLTIPNTGTLGGNGTIARQILVGTGGTLAPGNSIGKLTCNDDVTFTNATSSLCLEISGGEEIVGVAGTNYDQIEVNGLGKTINLNGTALELIPLSGIVAGQPYTILLGTGGASIAGTFDGLDNSATVYSQGAVSFTIDYHSTAVNITFTSVPEPTGLLAHLAIPLGCLLARRRKREN